MKEITFVVENGHTDAHGDKICLEGLRIPDKKMPVTFEFQPHVVIGSANLSTEEGSLKATAELVDEHPDGWPALGIQIISSEPNEHGGRNITEAVLHYVSINSRPNHDPSIKKLSEQTKE